MFSFIFLIFHLLLLTKINSSPIDEEVSANRMHTWKFDDDHSSPDLNKIQQPLDQLKNNNDNKLEEIPDLTNIEYYNRIVRFFTENKKKNKKNKKTTQCRKTKKGSKKRCPIIETGSTDDPPIVFPPEDLNKVKNFLINPVSRNQLEDFSKISDVIKNVTGLFPTNSVSILQKLAVSYADTTWSIKLSFADSCAGLVKFVVKAYHVMKRSMRKKDEAALKRYTKAVRKDTVDQFSSFANSSRQQLIDIHSDLLIKAHGAKMRALLDQRREKETDLIKKAADLLEKHSELSKLQADINVLTLEKEFIERSLYNSEEAKKETEERINDLENQISSYEQKIMEHRNTQTIQFERFWIFFWRVRDVAHNNGEAIARENLNRLLDEIRTLKDLVNKWSNKKSLDRLLVIRYNLTRMTNESNLKQELYRKYNESYNKTEADFFKIITDMKNIEETAGTYCLACMDAVDRLARAVQSGQESFTSAYATVIETIKSIDIDPDLLIRSIQSAIQFIQMGDDYMKLSRTDDIRQALGIQYFESPRDLDPPEQ